MYIYYSKSMVFCLISATSAFRQPTRHLISAGIARWHYFDCICLTFWAFGCSPVEKVPNRGTQELVCHVVFVRALGIHLTRRTHICSSKAG
jgi:hypothetical protein